MKKIYSAFIFMSSLFFMAGCSETDLIDNQQVGEGLKSFTSFTATLNDVAATRAYLADDATAGNKRVLWNDDDQIQVFSDVDQDLKYYNMLSTDGATAKFGGDKIDGNTFYAIYGGWDISFDETNPLKLYLSTGAATDDDVNFNFSGPMVAKTTGNELSFKQTMGLIHVSISNMYKIYGVEIYGNNDEYLSGEGYVDLSETNPIFRLKEPSDDVWLSTRLSVGFTEEEQDLSTGQKDVYFILPPMTLTHGFSLDIEGEDAEGNVVRFNKFTTKEVVVGCATVTHFALIDVNGELTETIPSGVISFEDPNVKSICVDNWDTDGDGELSYAEAHAVKSLGTVFSYRDDLKSFNELQYFTGLSMIDEYAFENSSLSSITIPKNAINIGHRAFGYNHLQTVISNNPRFKVYDDCMVIDVVKSKVIFNYNDQVKKEVVIPDFVTSIGETAFGYQFDGVTSVTIPNSVTTIEDFAFDDCRSLKSITIPSSVSSIGRAAFASCYSLEYVSIPSSVQSIGTLAFSGADIENRRKIDFVNSTSRYSLLDDDLLIEDGYRAISCLGQKSILTIPSYITDITEAFYWCLPNILFMESEVPPTNTGGFTKIPEAFVIYVSENVLDTYRTAEGWSDYAEYIRPLPKETGNIAFADGDVKAFCLDYWDVDKDGELSYYEAGMPSGNFPGTEMSGAIDHPYTFNEFRYFTGFDFIGGFYYCDKMKEVSIPENITSIDGYSGFGYCNGLEKITSYSEFYSVVDDCLLVDNRNNQIVFYFNSAEHPSITTPLTINSIGEWAFGHHNGVKSVVIPNSVTRIEGWAFCWNDSVETITIPETVYFIGAAAFIGCPSLKSITINATTPPEMGYYEVNGEWAFGNDDSFPIYVPSESLAAYQSAEGWSNFASRIQAIP